MKRILSLLLIVVLLGWALMLSSCHDQLTHKGYDHYKARAEGADSLH